MSVDPCTEQCFGELDHDDKAEFPELKTCIEKQLKNTTSQHGVLPRLANASTQHLNKNNNLGIWQMTILEAGRKNKNRIFKLRRPSNAIAAGVGDIVCDGDRSSGHAPVVTPAVGAAPAGAAPAGAAAAVAAPAVAAPAGFPAAAAPAGATFPAAAPAPPASRTDSCSGGVRVRMPDTFDWSGNGRAKFAFTRRRGGGGGWQVRCLFHERQASMRGQPHKVLDCSREMSAAHALSWDGVSAENVDDVVVRKLKLWRVMADLAANQNEHMDSTDFPRNTTPLMSDYALNANADALS